VYESKRLPFADNYQPREHNGYIVRNGSTRLGPASVDRPETHLYEKRQNLLKNDQNAPESEPKTTKKSQESPLQELK
jgi:hypothetical protein